MYKTLGFKWLRLAFCPASAFVSADRDEARNPQRFIHVSVSTNLKMRIVDIEMNKILNSLSNRDISLLVWISIIIVLMFFDKKIRNSAYEFLKTLFIKEFILVLCLFFLHTFINIFILHKLNLWNISLLKDTVFWIFSFAFVSMFNVNDLNSNSDFSKIILKTFTWTIWVEFFVNFFTFGLIVEIIILPILVLFSMLQAYASQFEEHKQADTFFKMVLTISAIVIFTISLYKTITNTNDFFNWTTLKTFALPILLSILFLPFLYIFNLVVKYDSLRTTINYWITQKSKRIKVKINILLVANINIDKVVIISKNITKLIKSEQNLSYDTIKKSINW